MLFTYMPAGASEPRYAFFDLSRCQEFFLKRDKQDADRTGDPDSGIKGGPPPFDLVDYEQIRRKSLCQHYGFALADIYPADAADKIGS